MSLALSTSWNSFRCNSAGELLSEIKHLGFNDIELSFDLTCEVVADIADSVIKSEIRVVSLHNFCPIPEGLSREAALPDYYSMASPDEEIRKKAVKYTKISIDTAQKLKARAVVLHCGRVEITDKTKKLAALFEEGQKETKKYLRLKDAALKEREKLHQPFLENSLRSLEELCRYAEERGVSLGIENRNYIREIPSFSEIGTILNRFPGAPIFYWHDTGHAQILENLGLNKHCEYLSAYGARLLGTHLHDCLATDDHRAPAQGDINFAILKPYVNDNTLKVIEAHYPASREEVLESVSFLKNIFNGRL